jgi:undecaprenyl-diphosphatase
MTEWLNRMDHSLFLFLNGTHSPFFDSLMQQATKSMVWIPLYLLFLYLVIRKYGWQSLFVLVITVLMITISDQLTNLAKESVCRLRPSQEPGLPVHLVNAYKGGLYGFYSSHASNTFAVAVLLIMILKDRYRWVFLPAILWAVIMSYSRIYLGVHFPGDILAGMVIGILLGLFFSYAVKKAVSLNLLPGRPNP